MVTTGDVFDIMNAMAPVEMRLGDDNVGLLAGRAGHKVTRVLTALDITLDVIDEAVELGAELIVSHHPLMFTLNRLTDSDVVGRRVLALTGAGIGAICMHTNLDVAERGVNDALARALGVDVAGAMDKMGFGRYGTVEEQTLQEFVPFVCRALNANGVRYVDGGRAVRKVAVLGGSGGSDLAAACELGCDTYVTADVKYHQFLEARERGLNLIDAGHFPTENVVVTPVAEEIRRKAPKLQVFVSARHRQAERFYVSGGVER